jgi:predicted  nucleic acid-binding Zn-ribbon protein
MSDVSGELIYELLKRVHSDVAALKEGQRDLRQDMISVRNQIHGLQGDVNALRATTSNLEIRLDRIETRLDLREFAEAAQKPLTS